MILMQERLRSPLYFGFPQAPRKANATWSPRKLEHHGKEDNGAFPGGFAGGHAFAHTRIL